jgi:hypothetical protein
MYVIRNDVVVNSVAYTVDGNVDIDVGKLDQGSLQIEVTDATPAAVTFTDTDVNATDNTITKAAHGLNQGQKIALTTNGTLPDPLTATNYWVIRVSSSVVKLATSAANALAGTAVNLTDAGSVGAANVMTPATLSVAITLYTSNDGVSYYAYATNQTTGALTATGGKMFDLTDKLNFHWLRIATVMTTGTASVKARLYGKALKD